MGKTVYLGEFTDGKDTWQEVKSVEEIRNTDNFDDTACYIYGIPLGEVILK